MQPGQREFRISACCGIAVVVLAWISTYYYVPLPGALATGFDSPILALEFAPTFSYAAALFADNQQLVLRYQWGHWLDMAFLVSYGLFLIMANLGAWRLQRQQLSLIGMIAAGVAMSADVAENLQLMQLTQALQGSAGAPDFWLLRLFASTKFLLICVALLCLIPLLKNQAWRGRLFAATSLSAAPLTVATLSGQFQFSAPMMVCIGLAWACLLLAVIILQHQLAQPAFASNNADPQTL